MPQFADNVVGDGGFCYEEGVDVARDGTVTGLGVALHGVDVTDGGAHGVGQVMVELHEPLDCRLQTDVRGDEAEACEGLPRYVPQPLNCSETDIAGLTHVILSMGYRLVRPAWLTRVEGTSPARGTS
jgi:hypothetical protein